MSSLITAIGPRLSQGAMDRVAGEIFRPKAQGDGTDADARLASAPGGAAASTPNQDLLSSFPGSLLEALLGSFTSPPPGDAPDVGSDLRDRYDVNTRPRLVMNEEDLGVGFPKGIPASVVEHQRQTAQEQYDAARAAQQKAAEDARKAEEPNRAPEGGGTDDPGDPPDMPNPDSGDPGGPRSFDAHLSRLQPLLVKAIAEVANR